MERLILLRQIMHHIQMEEKAEGMELAPFGIVGLETAFPLLYTHFVEKGILTLEQLIELVNDINLQKAFRIAIWKLNVGECCGSCRYLT